MTGPTSPKVIKFLRDEMVVSGVRVCVQIYFALSTQIRHSLKRNNQIKKKEYLGSVPQFLILV